MMGLCTGSLQLPTEPGGNEAEAWWNELEADAFDRLTTNNAKIADVTSVSNPSQVLPLSQRTGIAAHDAVTVVGNAPDLAALYQSSMLAVNPLLDGSGTRIKALEAAAFGLPLVSTAKGVDGLDLKEGKHAWITPAEPEAFASACIEALTSAGKRKNRAKMLRQHVTQRYERAMVTDEIANLVLEQLQSGQDQEEARAP